jgi:PAT family beta-lactamase induction signal transducer AmpG
MTQAGYRFGLLAAGAGALYLASSIHWQIVYQFMAALGLIGLITTLFAPLPRANTPEEGTIDPEGGWFQATLIAPFIEFFKRNTIGTAITILVFILLYKFGDAFAGVMANPFYILIGFTKVEIANVSKIFGVFATLLGVFLGGQVVKRLGILDSLLYCGILQMISNLMFAAQAAIGPEVGFLFLTIGIENLSGGMGSAAFVAYLSMLCNTAYTGTQYALFTSLMAFGRTWLSAASGWTADQMDWAIFFIISTFLAMPGLLLLMWMKRHLPIRVQRGLPNETTVVSGS